MWRAEDPQCNEAEKIRWEIVPYTTGKGLDLGCGPFKAYPHFIGVDNGAERWGTQGADVVASCEDLSLFADKSFDFVFSSHLLEHLEKPKEALKEWSRVIKDGGYLCLYLPHEDLYPKVGEPWANEDHKFNLNESIVERWMMAVGGWDLVRCEKRNEDNEYSFFMVFKMGGKGFRYSHKIKHEKTCAVVRYGAFGDLIQMSSILPGLKSHGYHITVYTTGNGYEIVKNDPHIDEFVVQGKDQVENHRLGEFWDSLKKKYDKFINLSESVEASLLAIPGRISHSWPHEVRHKYLNVNYIQFAHELAGVPKKPLPKFYPTKNEKEWAEKQKKAYGGRIILWSLAGSSVHKTWPWLDHVVARILMRYKDAKIVLVGDQACQMLETMEGPMNDDPRLIKKSGIWSIRQSLSFAQVADLVIGPETGLLNAVSAETVPKIITLSHSSVENLTRDWVNCISLIPKTACHPCHQMHYGFKHCHQDKVTGVAQCQADIGPDEMWSAVEKVLEEECLAQVA